VSTLRVAIVGAGWVVQTVWLPLLQEAGVAIVSIVDPSQEARRAVQVLAPGTHAHADLSPEALGDCDLALICSPNVHHVEHALFALAAGLHVILEKPACFDVAAAERLIDTSRRQRRGIWVTAATSSRNDVHCLLQQVRDGVLGTVNCVEVSWRRRAGIPRPGSWFTQAGSAIAGSGADLGWHLLEVGLGALDYPRVTAGFSRQSSATNDADQAFASWRRDAFVERGTSVGVDTQLFGALLTETGAIIQISAAWVSHQARDETSIRLYGQDGELALRSTFGFSDCGVRTPSLTLSRQGVNRALDYAGEDKMNPYRSFVREAILRAFRAAAGSDDDLSADYRKLGSLASAMAALYPGAAAATSQMPGSGLTTGNSGRDE